MRRLAISALLASASTGAMAHGGGLNAEGCHHERATGGYHCHRAPSSYSHPPPAQQTCLAPTEKIRKQEEKNLVMVTRLMGSGNVPRYIHFEDVDAMLIDMLDAARKMNNQLVQAIEEKTDKADKERDLLLQENVTLKARVKDLQGQVDLARTAIEALRKR